MNPDIKLFPYLLLRVAGGQYEDFQKTDLKETLTLLVLLQRKEEEANKLKEPLSYQFYTYISTVESAKTRRMLINLRRDIHNNRSIDAISSEIRDSFPSTLKKMFARYLQLTTDIATLKKEGEHLYQEETKQSKRAFAALLLQPNLQDGLLLSSATIMESLKKYLAADIEPVPVISQKERSFMEYLSRMYTKPTPFSTFTHLAVATFGKARDASSLVSSSSSTRMKAKSHLQLNHALYQYISGLMMQHPKVRKSLAIVPNFTIDRNGNEFVFLTNSRNQESFQHIAVTPALQLIYTITGKEDQQRTYQQLVKEAIKLFGGVSEEEVEAFIDQLLEIGFLEFNFGISGMDRVWDKKLAIRLDAMSDQFPFLKAVSSNLKLLRKIAKQYQEAGTEKRAELLNTAFIVFKNIYNAFSVEQSKGLLDKSDGIFRQSYVSAFTLKPHELWYEDVAFDKQFVVSDALKQPLDTLSDLLNRMGSLDKCFEEREVMAHFFNTTYEKDAEVGLLQFYREYYFQVKNTAEKPPNPLSKEKTANKKRLQTFMSLIKDRLNNDDVKLVRQDIAHIPPGSYSGSFSAFFQVYETAEVPVVVINDTYSGYGKMLSRFLYMFDPKLTDTIITENSQRVNDAYSAEPTDASTFNVNVHERLMLNEIVTPGGHTTLPSSAQIPVTHLAVKYHQKEKRLMLVHIKTKKEVLVFDLGFAAKTARSELYSLLSLFTPEPHQHTFYLTDAVNRYVEKRSIREVTIFPRITYEGKVVLQRKTWMVPEAFLPKRGPKEEDWSYFLKINTWRKSLGMPGEIFVRYNFNKPQYVSFKNPLLVSVFESIGRKCDSKLQIEEMLPHPSETSANYDGCIIEYVYQWRIDKSSLNQD